MQRIRLIPYPFFPDIRQDGFGGNHPALAGLQNVTMPWSSALSIEPVEGLSAEVLLRTSEQSFTNESGRIEPDFANYPENQGYYSWLFQLMYQSERVHDVHIGRFENLREEALRLFEQTGTPITNGITAYLKESEAMNSSPRPKSFIEGYGSELEQLVAEKEKYLIDQFGYEFS